MMGLVGNVKAIIVGVCVAVIAIMLTELYERVVNYPKIEAQAAAAEASKWQAAQDKARDDADTARKTAQAQIADAEQQIVNHAGDAQRIADLEQALSHAKGQKHNGACGPALSRGVRAKLDPIGR